MLQRFNGCEIPRHGNIRPRDSLHQAEFRAVGQIAHCDRMQLIDRKGKRDPCGFTLPALHLPHLACAHDHEQGRHQHAQRHDETAQLTYRSDFDAHLTTAKRLINIGNFDAARPYLVRALEINDSSPEAFNLAGVLAELKEDHDRARKMYGRAIKLDKNFEPAQQNMRRLFEMHHFGATQEPINMGND